MILAIIAKVGISGAVGHVFEFAGPVMRAMSMEQRMTVCNMSIEAGARAGLVAPDETTYSFLKGPSLRRPARIGNGARVMEDAAHR